MNKPSCGTCKHWCEWPEGYVGHCEKVEDYRAKARVFSDQCGEHGLETDHDFHCAHWEDKEREDA